jgi:ribose/xylose/arabinose/galactoside ABC-type transport system permease subunit
VRKVLARQPWLGPMAALVVTWTFFAIRAPGFASMVNAATMARQTTVVALCAVGMTLVIVSGGIDLSVGSAVAFTTVVVAATLKAGHGPVVAVLAGLAVATACGAISGAMIAKLRMAPFIVTLGAMSILRGAAKGVADEQKIDCDPRGLDALLSASSGSVLPPGVWIAVLVGVAGALALRTTRFGRHLYAVGSNEATARVCGVDVARVKIVVYAVAGALAGLAGVMQFSRLTVGDPTDSIGLELEVIAAVVIGGASLSGGEGTVLGSLVGAVLMAVIRTGCNFMGVHNWVQEIVTGGIIVVAVALDRLRHRRS